MIILDNFSSIFIANWKLNGNYDFIKEYYLKLSLNPNNCVVLCAPSIFLNRLETNETNLFSGAQDASTFIKGAYTGELSVSMLKDNNISFCLVGHSERRNHFKENNQIVNKKSKNLIDYKIIPIICVGETLEQKEKKMTKEILKKQIEESVPETANFKNALIAYEPVWAIGTGLTPTLKEIDEVHQYIKNLDKKFNNFKILYGGSVKPENSVDINSLKNVDGCLVGGASLKVEDFNSIIS